MNFQSLTVHSILLILAFVNLFSGSVPLFLLCLGLAVGVPLFYFLFYQTSHYFYIYIIKNRAFILPVKDMKGCTPGYLWGYVNTKMNRTRFFKCRFPSEKRNNK